nr:peptidoglycan recognition protein-S1 [Glyphodes pyloalis]
MFFKLFTVCACFCFIGLVSGDCGIVDKNGWGGLEPVHIEYLPRPVDLVIIQHTVTPSCSTDASCKDTVRGIQDYHMDQLGYWDIGASFYVGGNNKIYEGSGWLHVGAHTYHYNRRSIGISFIGNFNEEKPSNAMLEAVRSLLDCGVKQGHLKSDFHIVGHRQLISTISPGKYLYSKIRSWPEYLEDISSIKYKP